MLKRESYITLTFMSKAKTMTAKRSPKDDDRFSPLLTTAGLVVAGGALAASAQWGFTQEVPIPFTGDDRTMESTYYTDRGTPTTVTHMGVISPAVAKHVEKQIIPPATVG